MTLRMKALASMLALETAAAQWFAKMSPKERQVYIKAHPRSKYAKNTSGVLATQASKLSAKHEGRGAFHEARSATLTGKGKSKFAATHKKIMDHHDAAAAHYDAAASHFANGRDKEGHASLKLGHTHAGRANALFTKHKADRAGAKSARMTKDSAVKAKPTRKVMAPKTKPAAKAKPSAEHLDHHALLQKHGWELAEQSRDGSSYVHPKHPEHRMMLDNDNRDEDVSRWTHADEDGDNPLHDGKSASSLQKHLQKLHAKK